MNSKKRIQTTNPFVTIVEDTFVNSITKCWFIDREHGKWFTSSRGVLKGHCHPKTVGQRIRNSKLIGVENFMIRLKKKHGEKFLLVKETYVEMGEPATFIDEIFGEWITTPSNILNAKGHPKQCNNLIAEANKLSIDVVNERIFQAHGNQVFLIQDSYRNGNSKATFFDQEFGEWNAIVYKVASGQSHPRRRHLKAAKVQKSFPVVKHWKTQNECISASSYEYATLCWLNLNQIDFDWQVPVLTKVLTPGGKESIYYVDLFIKDGLFKDSFVEIKGYWGPGKNRSREKFDWLKANYLRVELWMKNDLKKLGILT